MDDEFSASEIDEVDAAMKEFFEKSGESCSAEGDAEFVELNEMVKQLEECEEELSCPPDDFDYIAFLQVLKIKHSTGNTLVEKIQGSVSVYQRMNMGVSLYMYM